MPFNQSLKHVVGAERLHISTLYISLLSLAVSVYTFFVFSAVDSSPTPQVSVSSSEAQGVVFQDGVSATGGDRSSAGENGGSGGGRSARRPTPLGSSTQNGAENGTKCAREGGFTDSVKGFKSLVGGGSDDCDGSSTSAEDVSSSEREENGREVFGRPLPTAELMSGGYAAPQA